MVFCNSNACIYSNSSKSFPDKIQKIIRCKKCEITTYCSEKCLKNHLEFHRIICKDYSIFFRFFKENFQSNYTLKDFKILNFNLGRGGFGVVKLVQEKSSKKIFALKSICLDIFINKNISTKYILNEIKIQRNLEHSHIIKFYDAFIEEKNVYLLLEYAENGNLKSYILKKGGKLNEKEAFVYFFQAALGVDYLHKKTILHRL